MRLGGSPSYATFHARESLVRAGYADTPAGLRMTQVYAALAHVHVTVYLAAAKLRTLASLYSTCARKKTKTTFFHEKLKVPTSKREGKLSNPRGRAARAMHGENLRKFTETRAAPPRAIHELILPRPSIQYTGERGASVRNPRGLPRASSRFRTY